MSNSNELVVEIVLLYATVFGLYFFVFRRFMMKSLATHKHHRATVISCSVILATVILMILFILAHPTQSFKLHIG